jgi:hypothetical protein
MFSVDPAAAAGLVAQLDRLHADARAGAVYVVDQTQLSYGGILNGITGDHAHAVAAVRDHLDKLSGPVAGDTAQAVRVALAYYTQTDAGAAARLDGTYPAANGGRADDYDGGGRPESDGSGFADVAKPAERYQPRPDHSGEFPYEPTLLAAIGPAAFGTHGHRGGHGAGVHARVGLSVGPLRGDPQAVDR